MHYASCGGTFTHRYNKNSTRVQQKLNGCATETQRWYNRNPTVVQQKLNNSLGFPHGSHSRHAALSLFRTCEGFFARGAIVSGNGRDDDGSSVFGVGYVAGVVDQLCGTAARAFHDSGSWVWARVNAQISALICYWNGITTSACSR